MNSNNNSRTASFRVMTFNIRGCFHRQDGVNVWGNRRALNIQTIQNCNPDIIGFQEVQADNITYYQDHLVATVDGKNCNNDDDFGGYHHAMGHTCKRPMHWSLQDVYHSCWKDSPSTKGALKSAYEYITRNMGSSSQQDEYVPIYWKHNRFDCIDRGSFYLSETPEMESMGWESKLIRAATWVRLREKATRAELIFVNAHFPHEHDDFTRSECSMVILQRLSVLVADDSIPHIILGDFNCHASLQTTAYAVFIHNGYQDTYDPDDGDDDDDDAVINTFHNFQAKDCPMNLGLIDWILFKTKGESFRDATPNVLVGGVRARIKLIGQAQIIRDAEPPLYPSSDHYPVLADFHLITQ